MIFIFGGAHQGMEEYARKVCGAREIRAVDEESREIDFSTGAVCGLERFALGCVRRGESPTEWLEAHAAQWADCILIGQDFSCGLVPMDAEMRLWREENGRMNNLLAGRAERVVRMFCGIAQVIK